MTEEVIITDEMVFGEVGIYDGDVIIFDRDAGAWRYPTAEQQAAIAMLWPDHENRPRRSCRTLLAGPALH